MSINKKQLFIFSLALLLFTRYADAQKEAYNWNFGISGGITFNSGAPVALTNSAIASQEGCASISDSDGNLLFYTNGEQVWNKNNVLMPNGTGFGADGIGGCVSSTQSALIVPQPGSKDIYYIFTSDCIENNFTNGYQYSIVDMSQDGGLGDVVTKGVSLYAPNTEKLTAVLHSNKKDIWIITHEVNSNNFRTYLLTETGILSAPVISSVGAVHTVPPSYGSPFYGGLYYMKASADGKKIALIVFYTIQLFDFDNTTGIVSNPISIPAPAGMLKLYGIEFSPDESKLYLSSINNFPSQVYQYDLNAGTAEDIDNSKVKIFPIAGSGSSDIIGAMQNGPDGRMYMARPGKKFLSVINDPNKAGTDCNYIDQGVPLTSNSVGTLGLPNFLPWYFSPPLIIASDTCQGQETKFSLDKDDFIQSVLWDFGDPLSGIENTSSSFNASHKFSSPGTFVVTAHITYTSGATVTVNTLVNIVSSPKINIGKDTLLCQGTALTLNVFQNGASYEWNTGSSDSAIVISQEGTYKVKIIRETCTTEDSINVSYHKCCTDTAIPNLITPNNDGVNDAFYAGCIGSVPLELEIYNRWNERIYYNKDYRNDWKGEGVSNGIYYFYLRKEGRDPVRGWIQIVK